MEWVCSSNQKIVYRNLWIYLKWKVHYGNFSQFANCKVTIFEFSRYDIYGESYINEPFNSHIEFPSNALSKAKNPWTMMPSMICHTPWHSIHLQWSWEYMRIYAIYNCMLALMYLNPAMDEFLTKWYIDDFQSWKPISFSLFEAGPDQFSGAHILAKTWREVLGSRAFAGGVELTAVGRWLGAAGRFFF